MTLQCTGLHINAVPLFADNTMIYIAIKSDQDAKTPQNLLRDWKNKWMMEFHPDKCEILSITKKEQLTSK